MNRKSFLKTSAFTLGALALANQRLLAGLLQQPAWKITMLTDEIGIFTERGGTIAFYIYNDGIVVVDAQWPEQSQHLITELKAKSAQPFQLLINTHHHLDHTSGNISFKGIVKEIVAHENSKLNQMRNAKLMKQENSQLYPTTTFKENWCGKYGKENICLYYYGPAHTNGDSVVHFEHADIVHMGDLVFNRKHAMADRTSGASIKNWVQVLSKVYKDFGRRTKFIFGHAGEGYSVVGTRDDLKSFSNYLSQTLLFVQSEIRRGKGLKDILKHNSIPGTPEWKGDGASRILQSAYEELTAIEPEPKLL